MLCLRRVGHASRHRPLPWQSRTLRRIACPRHPSLCAPPRMSEPLPPRRRSGAGATERSRSMRSMRASSAACGMAVAAPAAPKLRAYASSGKRQTIAPLTTVVPPRHRPCRMGMTLRPMATCVPRSRNSRMNDSVGPSPRSSSRTRGPSSTTTTSRPAWASTSAAVAPAAPLPTTTKSQASVVGPALVIPRRSKGRRRA